MKLSANFDSAEFCCACGCGACDVAPALVVGLQLLRDHLGKPVTILSGRRCATHNAAVGGEPHSQHLLGNAADIAVEGMDGPQLYGVARQISQFRGLGKGGTFLHVDVRPGPAARWCYGPDGKQRTWTAG